MSNGGKRLYVFSPTGEKLAFCDDISIECFAGFDESNGNFYYYGTTNWVYWGYDHTMQTLEVGNLNGSTITHGSSYVTMLYQCYFHDHYGCVELFADKYLASLSTFYGGDLVLFDSDSIKPSDVSSEIETVELDNGVSVSSVALPKKTILNAWGTSNRQTVDIGSRSAYVEGLDAIAVAAGAQEVVLYDTSDWEPIAKVDAAASIHRIMTVGDHLVLIELNDDSTYSVESFNSSAPTRIDISGSSNVEVGSCPDYTVTSDSDIIPTTTFTSSDPSILSIDNEGKAAAWKAGTVTITAKTKNGLTKTLRVTVSGTGVTATRDEVTTLSGTVANNCYYSEGINESYIVENGQGFMLVDASSGDLEIQYRDASGKLTSKKTVKHELEYFGGFFKGEGAYYVAYGATNFDESDDTTVVRVVKYDTSWKRLAACDLKGANTTWAFRAGSVSMDEGAGKLIVHTCHQMYQSGDGYRHQANMTLKIDEASMTMLDSYTDVMNLSEGYVSHSFDEIVRVVDGKIYRADRGDAYPRGLAFTITPLENELGDPTVYTTLAEFSGNIGANYTGSTLGGMEVSDSGALVAYGEDVEYGDFTRDVKLAVYDESSGNVTVKKLTSYTSGGNLRCLNMNLVRLNGRHFLLMWAEQNTSTNRITTRIARLDQHGNVIGDIVERRYMNSDCQPILLSDGNVAWYAADSWGRELYTINPYDLTAQIAWPFKDVSIATPHREDICWLAAQGISTGWGTIPNANFRPYDTVKRADMAAFIFRLAKLWGAGDASDSWQPNSSTRSMFLDVNEDTPHAREIWWLAEKGISMGWDVSGGKEFRPYANVARADLAAFLGRLAKLAGRGQSVTPARSFADVTSSTAHHDEIWWIAGAGISTDWDENGTKTFRPLNDVKRCDMAAFLRRMDKLS